MPINPQPWSSYANNPSQVRDTSNLIPQLRAFLKEKLPEYMVPSTFVVLDALPLTPSGKIDRRALPAPSRTRPVLREAFVAPCTLVEERLAGIWSEILGIEPVGINDNFFELGGHSLLAAQLLSHVQQTFQVELPLFSFLEVPTVAGLIQAIITTYRLGSAAKIYNTTVGDLNAEVVLDPTIFPEPTSIELVNEPKHIFLTGATGFLGAFLINEILQQTKATIYCLVRSSSRESGKQKIQINLERYLLWDEELSSRIIPVLGDLSQPFLGLGEQQFRELAGEIDLIYHNGAFVNLIYPYTALRATNVLGTQEILRLASQIKVKPVHFISTLDVFQSPYYSEIDVIREQDDLAHCIDLYNGYSQSKWVAEKLVMAARSRGIPICVYRPGMISGHSQTGVSNKNDLICRMIKSFIQLGSAPNLDLMINIAPVDYVSRAIICLSRQKESLEKAFHLVNPYPLLLSKLVNEIRAFGYPVQQISYEKWQAELLSVDISQENALSPLVSLFTEKISEKQLTYLETSSLVSQTFDCQNTVDGLAGDSIVCPPVDARLLSTYFSYFTGSGFLETPQP